MNDIYLELSRNAVDDRERLLLSTLPALAMLSKLMTRKENGKRPYSEAFAFPRRIEEVHAARDRILQSLVRKDWNQEEVRTILEPIEETCLLAEKEVRMVSLKEDFQWILKTLENAIDQEQGGNLK